MGDRVNRPVLREPPIRGRSVADSQDLASYMPRLLADRLASGGPTVEFEVSTVSAAHGGKIEVGTDDQATSVVKALAQNGKPVRAWVARGFNPKGAHRCWHITASEISEQSFPGWARSSVPARPADRSLTPSRSTARTTPRQSSSAAGFPGTRRTTHSR